jgi:hypothetical protein
VWRWASVVVSEWELGAAWPMGWARELESELELALALESVLVLSLEWARELESESETGWALVLVLGLG